MLFVKRNIKDCQESKVWPCPGTSTTCCACAWVGCVAKKGKWKYSSGVVSNFKPTNFRKFLH